MKRANYKRNDIKKLWKGPFTKEIVLKAMKMANYNRNARGRRGGDRMVVGFTTTCAISAYHHESCDFEPRAWRGVLDRTLCDKVCQWLATGRWFSRYNCKLLKVTLNAMNQNQTKRNGNKSYGNIQLQKHLSSPPAYCGVRVTRSLVLCVCLVDRCLSICTLFCHWVVCSSSIYGFWLPLWYLQALRTQDQLQKKNAYLLCEIFSEGYF
jgi:hypothetical protein